MVQNTASAKIINKETAAEQNKEMIEKKILRTSFFGCVCFLIAEIVIAVITGSQAIFVDCLWDGVNIIMVIPMLILVPMLAAPVSAKRPFGLYPVESLLVVIKCGVLTALCILLIIDNIQLILAGGNDIDAGILAVFELIVCIFCVFVYMLLKRMEKGYETPIIEAEVYIWKMDAFSTLGVSAGFGLKLILERTPAAFLGHYIDPVIATVVAVSLLREPLSMVLDNLKNLTLRAPSREVMTYIEKVVADRLQGSSFRKSFLEVIKTGRKYWVSVYVEPETDEMSFEEIRSMTEAIKNDLAEKGQLVYVELIPDLEAGSYQPPKPARHIWLRRSNKHNLE